MNELEIIKIKINTEKSMTRTNLKRRLNSTITSLQIVLDRLEKEENFVPNSCGVVQGEGLAIDELCIRLALLESLSEN